MDNNNSLFSEEEWEDIQKILEENARALERFYETIDRIFEEDK